MQQELLRQEVIYSLDDPHLPQLHVKKSANAWWRREGKLQLLVAGLKMGFTVKNACILAGISFDQYRYFLGVHPEFYHVKDVCEQLLPMKAQANIFQLLVKEDPRTIRWYAERAMPEKYGRPGKHYCPKCLELYREDF